MTHLAAANSTESAPVIPGFSYRIFYGAGNINNQTIHVLAIIEGHVAFKYWLKTKGYYRYTMESLGHFEILKSNGCLKSRGRTRPTSQVATKKGNEDGTRRD